ncbi:uncharacterized protein ACRADG_004863 isoform 2-T2 [Cochliomyia hominivorax]
MHLINCIFYTFCTIFYIIINLNISLALRDVRVQIPHAVRKGEKAILKCLYDLEGDSLYSVKWYKGRREFYSFTPKETPAMKVFQFGGVKVARSSSNESQLVLENVNSVTSGKYSCEVSADAPSFHTLIGAGELEVVVPGKDPVITGIRPRYKVGDILRGNCTSSHSRPAANITWTVNGYETNPAHIRHFKPHKDLRELETVISAIHFVVTPQHFIYGKLKIRCTAFIHDVYWKSTEKSIEENRLNKEGSANVVHKFSEDYFDLEDDNVIDRSDTYMTHIKGDVSSLNASGCSALHKCSCFWLRLTTLLLVLYTMQQLLQLFQQLLIQTATTNKATKMKQKTKTRQNKNIYDTTNVNKEKGKNLLKIKTAKTTISSIQQQQNIRRCLATEMSPFCEKNKTSQNTKENKAMQESCPRERYFQIKLIKTKHLQSEYKNEEEYELWQIQSKMYIHTATYNKQLQLSQLQLSSTILVLKILKYICYKKCLIHDNFNAQFSKILPNNCSISLNTATSFNTITIITTATGRNSTT